MRFSQNREKLKISVALATYNGARFLPEQLESFLSQTVLPDEIIVSDDCSTDETVAILREFAARADFPVKIHENPKNLGSTENFAAAIAQCSGDLIFLSDQDDVWLPGKIEKIRGEFEQNAHLGFVFTDAELVDEKLGSLGVNLCDLTFDRKHRAIKNRREIIKLLMLRNYATGATAAFRRELRNLFLPFPADIPEMIHDGWIALVSIAAAEFKFLDETLVKYRQHDRQQLGAGLSGQKNDKKIAQMIAELNVLRAEAERVEKIRYYFETKSKLTGYSSLISEIADENSKEITEKIIHYETRTTLPAMKRKRIQTIWRETKSGRYHKFAKGYLSAVRDFIADY